jgi:nucleoside-diphosphate-sugar epimerase
MGQNAHQRGAPQAFASFEWPLGRRRHRNIRRVVGRPALPVRAFPWWMLALAFPFVPLFRELREMRYLWRTPVRMSNTRLVRVLGSEPHTPLDDAIRATLRGLGCLTGDRETRTFSTGH